MDRIISLLDGDHALAAKLMLELDTNPLTTFVSLLLAEEKTELDAGKAKSGGLIDDSQCKR